MAHRFVGLPKDDNGHRIKTFLRAQDRSKKVVEVMWGDWLWVDGEEPDGWLRVIWGRTSLKPQTLYIEKAHTTEERPLEIIFMDVGQGDGAVLITPEKGANERVIIIDAGLTGRMHQFLSKRFGGYNGKSFRFHAAIITHPDNDHYLGFETIFKSPLYGFEVIYHSGLVERPVGGTFEKLGRQEEDSGVTYITGVVDGRASIAPLFPDSANTRKYDYPRVMLGALGNPGIDRFALLSTATATDENGRKWMPGFAPSDGRAYQIEVLGPVVEHAADGRRRLRRIGSYGETKNGHSVILRLHYNGFKVLFGGDLNDKAEKFLLAHYAGAPKFPTKAADQKAMIEKAAGFFRSDIMKVCHHGSEKVTDAFLETVFPAAFVISSGDEEGHVHPRPDLLGRLGRLGRGEAPLILSTELQRSTREMGDEKLASRLMGRLLALEGKPSEGDLKMLTDGIADLSGSNVTVDGTIYLKTNGVDLLVAFRIETGSQTKKWFVYQYRLRKVPMEDGERSELELVR